MAFIRSLALRFELVSHLVKGATQCLQIAGAGFLGNLFAEIAQCHPAGCIDEIDDQARPGDPRTTGRSTRLTEETPAPRRRTSIRRLSARLPLIKKLVELDFAFPRLLQLPDDISIDGARDIKVAAVEGGQFDQRTDVGVFPRSQQHQLVCGLGKRLLRWAP